MIQPPAPTPAATIAPSSRVRTATTGAPRIAQAPTSA